jgi:type IV pilus assembly protein PilF
MKKGLVVSKNKVLMIFVIAGVLSGCVTEQKRSLADNEKALQYTTQLARNYVRDGKWEAAQRHLKAAQEIDPKNAEVNELMAMVYANTGEMELADRYYRSAVSSSKSEEKSRIRNNYAAFLYKQKEYAKAADELENVVTDVTYSNRALAFLNLGRCYIQLKEYSKAKVALDRAYQFNQADPLLLLELTDVYFLQKEYSKSQQFYDQFRKMVKTQTPRSLWLGIQLADQFGDTNAISSYGLVLKNLYPKSQEYLDYRAKYE